MIEEVGVIDVEIQDFNLEDSWSFPVSQPQANIVTLPTLLRDDHDHPLTSTTCYYCNHDDGGPLT